MSKESLPHVAVVIVSHNGRHNLEYSLPSLIGQDYPNFDVYVADNASSDGTPGWLREKHPTVKHIDIGANVGMSAMNAVLDWGEAGSANRASRYVFVAGWDLVFDRRCIRHAVEAMERDPEIGMLGFRVLGLFEWVDPSELARESERLGEITLEPTNWVPGACSFIRRAVLDIVGFIDPVYFAYAEEDDLQYRFRKAGYRTLLLNTPVWQNVREASIPLPKASYLAIRNSIRFSTKNYGMIAGLRQALHVAVVALLPMEPAKRKLRVYRRLRPFTPVRNLPIVAKAYAWNLVRLPQTIFARVCVRRQIGLARTALQEKLRNDRRPMPSNR